MISCPNCSKQLNETFEYCNECGSSLKGGKVGDFKTSITNVFFHCDGFLYLYAKNGHQIILRADSLDNLKKIVFKQNLFWLDNDFNVERKTTRKVKKVSNTFLEISSMAKSVKKDTKQKHSFGFKKNIDHVTSDVKKENTIKFKPKRILI